VLLAQIGVAIGIAGTIVNQPAMVPGASACIAMCFVGVLACTFWISALKRVSSVLIWLGLRVPLWIVESVTQYVTLSSHHLTHSFFFILSSFFFYFSPESTIRVSST
jgi:hypothetical protein